MRFIVLLSIIFASALHAETIYTPEKNLIIRQEFAPNAKELADQIRTPYIKVVKEQINFNRGSVYDTMMQAIELVELIVNSETFKEQVIGYMNTSGQRAFTRNEGLSNEEVYLRLMEGREVLDQETPGEMNLYIQQYNRWWSKVIGYTKIGKSKWIWVNWKFYKNFDASEIAGNVVHEWIHLMGFYHDSASDHDSVPYAVGYIARNLISEYIRTGHIN
tara:strand:- start:163323 stop:163976 length:654 start_codon:yes stop_codon:yes gene_type:complete